MMSVAPAITLRTKGSARIVKSAPGDTLPDHLLRVDDFVKSLLVDVAGFERGLLQGQVPIVGLVRDHGGLVIADLRAESRHQHQRAADHLVDALAVELRALDREMTQFLACIAENAGRMQEIVY